MPISVALALSEAAVLNSRKKNQVQELWGYWGELLPMLHAGASQIRQEPSRSKKGSNEATKNEKPILPTDSVNLQRAANYGRISV